MNIMHPKLRDQLKNVIMQKRVHYDPKYLMDMTRKELEKNRELTSEREILKAQSYGKWMLREEQGRVRFKQYRELKKRYG